MGLFKSVHYREVQFQQNSLRGTMKKCPLYRGVRYAEVQFQQKSFRRTPKCPLYGGVHYRRFYCIFNARLGVINESFPPCGRSD